MSTASRLTEQFERPALHRPGGGLWAIFSDHHYGDGWTADNSLASREALSRALAWYTVNGYQLVLAGDWVENWQFPYASVYVPPSVIRLRGNHDDNPNLPESLVIEGDPPILVVHGHQGDFWNDSAAWLTKLVVRYPWTFLEWVGIKEPSDPEAIRHQRQRVDLLDWANSLDAILVCGHTHLHEHIGHYWNTGKCCDGRVQCIEIVNRQLWLMDWSKGQRRVA